MELRTFSEDELFGVSYVMWFCRACNKMCTSQEEHNLKYHLDRRQNK